MKTGNLGERRVRNRQDKRERNKSQIYVVTAKTKPKGWRAAVSDDNLISVTYVHIRHSHT